MKSNQFFLFLLPVIFLFMCSPVLAQQSFKISGPQEFTVAGTSSIHDWEMDATEGISGAARMTIENAKLSSIQALGIVLPVKSLKSGKGSMDNNAYEALVEKTYPAIKFDLTEFVAIKGNLVQIKGKLTIAGASKTIPLEATYSIEGESVTFSGSIDILFSEYNVAPPTAVFGTIKTGDELTLSFQATFSPQN